ncbi:Coenzyme F420 hydrogenase/dehydrogenase, beta subunit C-terminal domain [Paraclostridium bifermentans]|uniref:Coenzyme F420 hydrogenase/dehydrogenase, beta subunit C-terminal domain n=1 Tax=Paraclostridium bifermentans TaxID=1490 RepID=UPI00359CA279
MNKIDKKECCGCYGCYSVCPKKCITMEVDEEGFKYPKVDENNCINCGLCEAVCPFKYNDKKISLNEIKAYACKNRDKSEQTSSSSGGIFIALCNYIMKNKGFVFGACFDENLNVVHQSAKDINECYKFKGSKYVQSDIKNSYIDAKRYLDEGRLVLFSGVQCQIKGLNLFLNKIYDNLICVEIICHGVPSPLVFDKYKEYLTKKYNSNIKNISFRYKEKSWINYNTLVEFENCKKYSNIFAKDIYMKGFLQNIYLRPSCYACKAKGFNTKSDISLADYWGIQKIHPEFYDNNGVSLVCVNTDKGNEIFKSISENIDFIETDLNKAKLYNACIYKSVNYNEKRNEFFKDLLSSNDDIESLISKHTN